MFNLQPVKGLFTVVFLGLIFAIAASCGGGSSDGTGSAGTGGVALLLTDAPSDIFEEINITVTRAELLSDDGKVTIFQGNRTFNLLDLTDAKIFAIRDGVAAGTYSKIRLTLSQIELVDYNNSNDPVDYLIYYPNLPGNGKLDLNPRGSFNIVTGGTLTIQIDMDASKSIHIVGNGKDRYQFRPVVFIDIVTDAFVDRYVQLHGDITALDTTDVSFKLCNTDIPVQVDDDKIDDSSNGCVRVETDSTTSIFDSNGQPVTFSALVEGQPATVFGRLQQDSDSLSKGDDDEDNDNDNDNDDNDEKDNDDDRELDDLVLKAALIELGSPGAFQKLNGTATSAVNSSNLFTMDVAAGQGFATPSSLNVQIQQGTLLVNRKGAPVAIADINNGKLVNVRGVIDNSTDTIFASLIVIDTDSSSQLSGTVGAPDNSCGFTLNTSSGDISVATGSNSQAFLVVDGTSTPIIVSELNADQAVDVYGNANSATSCFDADVIIAY
ncbi:MAG: DUF4382 domain-containing protein [Gammaproteobacteria bacterium]|nr:DUF4382 domain-containing protein [Gammaproteobacteria bacterium]